MHQAERAGNGLIRMGSLIGAIPELSTMWKWRCVLPPLQPVLPMPPKYSPAATGLPSEIDSDTVVRWQYEIL